MAKTTAPLLGFGAAGQIGKTQVYAKWKGRGYARRYIVPANPNSAQQQETRGAFAWLMEMWKRAAAEFQAPWTAFAKGQVLTNRNALAKFNVSSLRGAADKSAMVFSPGSAGGIAPVSIAATGGAGTITVTLTNPTPPTGWTISGATATAVDDTAAATDLDFDSSTATATTPFTTINLPVPAAGLYRVGAWLTWTKPDGSTAYSVSLNTTATAT